MQAFPIRGERGRKRVERDVFVAIRPAHVSRNFREHLETVHELHNPAGFESLARVGIAGAAILVAGETAAWELPVSAHELLVIALSLSQISRCAGLGEKYAGLAKTLG